jgi:hypothetical protein
MKSIKLASFMIIVGVVSSVHGMEFKPVHEPVSIDEIDALGSIDAIKLRLKNEIPLSGEIVVWRKVGGESNVIHRQSNAPLLNLEFTVVEHPALLDGPADSNDRVIRTRIGGVPPEETDHGWSAMGGEARPYRRQWETGITHRQFRKLALGRNIIYLHGVEDGMDVLDEEGNVDLNDAWGRISDGMMIEIILKDRS